MNEQKKRMLGKLFLNDKNQNFKLFKLKVIFFVRFFEESWRVVWRFWTKNILPVMDIIWNDNKRLVSHQTDELTATSRDGMASVQTVKILSVFTEKS